MYTHSLYTLHTQVYNDTVDVKEDDQSSNTPKSTKVSKAQYKYYEEI